LEAIKMGKTVRSIFIFASVLTACAMTKSALADPILECGLLAGKNIAVGDCLRTQLDISYRAMLEAQELALTTARQLDERTGTEVAVLGLEASQQAWEAYRDVECQTVGVFAGDATPGDTAQLACEIRLTRARTDALLRLTSQGS
jgi:uncharacterized protein YecT (DUF1311 family)